MHASSTTAVLLALASTAAASSCAASSRYGDSSMIAKYSRPLVAGNAIVVKTNYTCAHALGIKPAQTEYRIVPTKAGAPSFWLATHKNPPTLDTETFKIPDGRFEPNAGYQLQVLVTYPVKGPGGGMAYEASAGEKFAMNIAPTVKN